MLRTITAFTLLAIIALTTPACSGTGPLTGNRGYCDAGSHGRCSGLEGDGQCQPCSGSAVR